MILGTIFTFIEILTSPIWIIIVYVITGNDPMREDYYYGWKYSMKFLDWYKNKFGPNDD